MLEKIFAKLTKSNILFGIMTLIFLIFVFRNPDIAIMFFAALVFACSLSPLVTKLSKRFSRPVATSIVLFGSIAILAVLILPILVMAGYQIGSFANEFPRYITDINKLVHSNHMLLKLGISDVNIATVFDTLANLSSNAFNNIVLFIGGLGSAFVYVFLSVIFIFYLLCDKDAIKSTTLRLFPSEMREKASQIIDITGHRIGGYIFAQLCAIASVGIVMLAGLMLFKIQYAVLLALITAILDIIPVIGPAIALIIGLVVTHEAGWGAMAIVAVVFATAQLIENNIVRPFAFGKLLKMHPIIIFFALFVAAKYFGIIGALFAPAMAATACVLVEELYIKNLD